jgi:hypothetical protein
MQAFPIWWDYPFKQIFRAAEEATPSLSPPTVLFRLCGGSGSFQPEDVSLVMALKQWGLGLGSRIILSKFSDGYPSLKNATSQ